MNKQMEMGKTMFEVMKMRKNNKQNPFPLRKYYGAMVIGWRTTVRHSARGEIRQNRKSAWKKNRSELITAQHRKKQKQQRKTREKQRQRHK